MFSQRAGFHEVRSDKACDDRQTLPWFKRWRAALVDLPAYSSYERWRVLPHQLENGLKPCHHKYICYSLLLYSITSVFSLRCSCIFHRPGLRVQMLLLYTSLSYGICTYVRTYTCTCDRCCLYLGCPRQPGVDVLLGEVITGTDTEQLVLINW